MNLIRLTTRSDESVHLDPAHITAIWPGGGLGMGSFIARDNGRVLAVKEAPERVRAMLDRFYDAMAAEVGRA